MLLNLPGVCPPPLKDVNHSFGYSINVKRVNLLTAIAHNFGKRGGARNYNLCATG